MRNSTYWDYGQKSLVPPEHDRQTHRTTPWSCQKLFPSLCQTHTHLSRHSLNCSLMWAPPKKNYFLFFTVICACGSVHRYTQRAEDKWGGCFAPFLLVALIFIVISLSYGETTSWWPLAKWQPECVPAQLVTFLCGLDFWLLLKNREIWESKIHISTGQWVTGLGWWLPFGLGHVMSSSSQSPPPTSYCIPSLSSLSCLLGSSRYLSHLSYFALA